MSTPHSPEQSDTISRALVLHELRGPLTVLHGYFELLGRPLTGQHRHEALAGARSALARLEAMIDDLDDVDITLLPRRPAETACVCLRSLAEEVAAEFNPLLHNEIEVAGADSNVQADAGRLRQAIANLLANAAAYGPEDGRILVRIEPMDGEVRLAVEDEGHGVDPAQRELVFEPGRRLAANADVPGSGLGLPIVRMIARAHGGDARAEDAQVLSGARFVIELPESR